MKKMANLKIKKRDGTEESLRRGKIERSVRDSGATSQTSKNIAESIELKEGMTSDEIRRIVSSRLREEDTISADTYDKQRRLTIHQSDDVNDGKILLDNTTLRDMNLKPGDDLSVVLSTIKTFQVGKSERKELGAYINNNDLRSLNFNEGHKIIVRRN